MAFEQVCWNKRFPENSFELELLPNAALVQCPPFKLIHQLNALYDRVRRTDGEAPGEKVRYIVDLDEVQMG